MSEVLKILIIDADQSDAGAMVLELEKAGFVVDGSRVETEPEYLAALEQRPEVILSESSLPSFDCLTALELLQARGLHIPFILVFDNRVLDQIGEDRAVDAMKRGACGLLWKDRLATLGEAVRRALEERRLRRSEERYRVISETSSDFIYSLKVDENGALACDWISEPFTRITGFTMAEINERGWKTLYYPADRPVMDRHFQTLRNGQPASMDVRILTKAQPVHWACIHDRPLGARQK
jgi:PAS domain S-box-containing protein